MSASEKKRVCLGAVAGAHGVRGEFKIKAFTQTPEMVAAYGPVETEDGRRLTLTVIGNLKNSLVLARAPEIKDRNDAEALKGARLYIERAKLPATEPDEFYLEDLVGLSVFNETGAPLGMVAAVYNFGAGDIIELKNIPDVNGVRLIAFTKENVPAVDLDAGRLVLARGAVDLDETPEDPSANEAYIEAAMRQEDA